MKTGALHIGDNATCKRFLKDSTSAYIYILRRPDGRPFYVGKGGGGNNKYRALDHENEARHPNNRLSNAYKLNVIRSIWRDGKNVQYEIDGIFPDDISAYERETQLISFFKRLHEGGSLTNLAPGGGSEAGASPISKEKHAATLGGIPDNDPERATINGFVLSIYPALEKKLGSIPIKPSSRHIAKPAQRFPSKRMGATVRQAVALVASAAAHGVSLEKACDIPRLLEIEGVPAIIESGVASDILTSGLGSVIPAADPKDEIIHLNDAQARQVLGLAGYRKCLDLGVISDAYFKANGGLL